MQSLLTTLPEIYKSVVWGILEALATLFPSSPELITRDPALLLPAYLGSAGALMFYFWEGPLRQFWTMFRGGSWAELRYLLIAGLITFLLGIPVSRFQIAGEVTIAVTGAIALGVIVVALTGLKPKSLEKLREAMEEKPSVVDSMGVGVLQALANVPGISRSGLAGIFLMASDYTAEEVLRFSLEVAPLYLIARAVETSPRVDATPHQAQAITVFIVSFLSTVVVAWLLLKLAETVKKRTFFILYGIVGVIVSIVGVIL